MSEKHELVLEVLSGPLDGAMITLAAETEWTRAVTGPLAFPWDAELDAPQARFSPAEGRWWLAGLETPHSTYRVNEKERITSKVQLAKGDSLKASDTWLLVREA